MSVDAGRCAICEAELDPTPLISGADMLHSVPGTFRVHVCPGCGAGNSRPHADQSALASYYPSEYGQHGRASDPVAERLRRLLTRREMRVGAPQALRAIEAGRLLDVGCGTGALGSILVGRGWQVDGVEPSQDACEQARRVGVRARAGNLETVSVASSAYDAVVFHQSLEHIEEPLASLRRSRDALAPDGLLGISVPNFDCLGRRRFGRNWVHLDLPRHRIHYGERSLRLALERSGFEPVRLWTSTSSTGLVGSRRYRASGRLPLREGAGRLRLALLAALLLIPAARLEQAAGGGHDFLHAVARRGRLADP